MSSSIEKAMKRKAALAESEPKGSVASQEPINEPELSEDTPLEVTAIEMEKAETSNVQHSALESDDQPAVKPSKENAPLEKNQDGAKQGGASVIEGAGSKPIHKSNQLFINLNKLETQGFVALSEKRTLINEEYRSIKRKLLNNAFGPISKTLKNSNLILVSSSKPNEGKTFTSVNLALSIALEQDKTVLLVDADVLKPSVANTLDIGDKVGLIEYLLGEEQDVSKIIYPTNVENLKVLPAGLPHHLSNELLSSQKMITLIEEFATRYPDRVVVFDAPPLLGVNETTVMAEQCGQGVVVVEEHKSKMSDVQQAVDLLPEYMAVGFVINKSVTQDNEHGYGYGYGYYYGARPPKEQTEDSD